MRIPVLVALAVPVVLVSGVALYSGVRPAVEEVRTYYVAADEVPWDYVAGGRDQIEGVAFADSADFKTSGRHPYPTRYLKALYREYTDSTFTRLKERAPEWRHLGFLGPLIRAEVGDTIHVVFRNRASFPAGMHPHGVFYDKDSEGAPYADGTSGADKADDAVPTGGTHVYTWAVPERAGPGPDDHGSVLWMYHSHTDEVKDVNTGLMGPMIVYERGGLRGGHPHGIDRELVVMFGQTHEEMSWYADRNLPMLANDPPALPPNAIFPFFVFFSVNGYTHGAMPLDWLTVRKGEHVRWYVFASTGDFDFHTPHWHGNTVLIHGMRTDVGSLEPMEMITADMVPDDPGTWFFHCHVSDHLMAGMQARYRVADLPAHAAE